MQRSYSSVSPTKSLFGWFALLFALSVPVGLTAQSRLIDCDTLDCIRDAVAAAQPGDEIVVASGTYTGGRITGAFDVGVYLHPDRSGTTARPIASSTATSVDVRTLAAGMYVIEVRAGTEVRTARFTKR